MNWKIKAAIQNAIALLPETLSLEIYYRLQRNFGELKRPDVMAKLASGFETCSRLRRLGFDITDRTFFEVGTGRSIIMPIAYWLAGARATVTIDLNVYLRDDLLAEMMKSVSAHENAVRKLFGHQITEDRLRALIDLCRASQFNTKALFDLTSIEYIAPANAGSTGLATDSIDVHTSYTVLKHIPKETIKAILIEGNRITKPSGIFIHRIDYSDHFSHSDPSIASINFLRYSERIWRIIAGNRYMYMNRLRHDEFLKVVEEAKHVILEAEPEVDVEALELLQQGKLKPDFAFEKRDIETLAIRGAWIVSKGPNGAEMNESA